LRAYSLVTTGTRFRAPLPPDATQLVPPEAVEGGSTPFLHWWAPTEGADPFLDGALWALHWSLTTVFGTALGTLLRDMTLVNVERNDGTGWVPVA
jgi:hypothetical protein